jgi:hypothetical protein
VLDAIDVLKRGAARSFERHPPRRVEPGGRRPGHRGWRARISVTWPQSASSARTPRVPTAPVAVTLGLAEPVVPAILGLVVVGERLTAAGISGLILVGLALATLVAPAPLRPSG